MLINESQKRRPDGSFEVAVRFPDGQDWFLPRPRIRVRPRIVDGQVTTVNESTLGPDYLDLLEAYYRAQSDESDGAMDRFNAALMSLTMALLRVNYDLTDDELCSLIVFDYSQPPDLANEDFRRQLIFIALGLSQKKTSDDGSSPT